MRLSIIIPVLNEARTLPGLLAQLQALRDAGAEVVVVDGGSDDESRAVAERAHVHVIRSARGRARQMNAGAATATGDVLLFLHADTALPANALPTIATTCANKHVCWGRFDVLIDGSHPMLRIVAAMMNLRSRVTGIATGDQALFVTRAAFDKAGGFPDQPLMEDIELSRRLCRIARPVCLRERVVTSGRRWESRGVWRTIGLMWLLRAQYFFGVSPARLAARYR